MATQFVDIIGEGFVQGVPGTFGNCRVFYDDVTHAILHVGPLYSTWNGQGGSSNDGAVAPPNVLFYNVRTYGALGDGVSDDTALIAAARLVASVYGGIVFYPAGTYISGNQPLYSNVTDLGAGIDATIIKLKNGANADLFSGQTSSINLSASLGAGSVGTLSQFAIKNMTLDGNKANQSSGTSYPLRCYGYAGTLQDVAIKNGYSGGILHDWNGGGAPNGEGNGVHWSNARVHDCNGIGIQYGGPLDADWVNVQSYQNGSHNFHIAPNALNLRLTNCQVYLNPNATGVCCFLIEGNGAQAVNCMAEGSYHCNVALIANSCSWMGGQVFSVGADATTVVGIQLGQQAGQTPFPGQINQSAGVTTAIAAGAMNINTAIIGCNAGALAFKNEGNSLYNVTVYQTTGSAYVGTPNADDVFNILVNGGATGGGSQFNGLVPNLEVGNFGVNTLPNSAIAQLMTTDADAHYGLVIYPHSATQSVPLIALEDSNFSITFTVDQHGAMQLQGASTFYSGSGAPSNGNGNNGDYYFRSGTPGTANQRIYVKSAGAWVGVV